MTHPSAPSRGRPRGRPRLNGRPANPDDSFARLQLDGAAKQAIDSLCERRGMTQIAALSRFVRWLVSQDEIMQAWVLGLVSREDLAEILKRTSKRKVERDSE